MRALKPSESFTWCYHIRDSDSSDSKARWRDPTNPLRKSPFMIERLPTIVKVAEAVEGISQCWIDDDADNMEWTRLVEGDCYDQQKLDAFVGH
jgi:hypothetical protein